MTGAIADRSWAMYQQFVEGNAPFLLSKQFFLSMKSVLFSCEHMMLLRRLDAMVRLYPTRVGIHFMLPVACFGPEGF